MEEASVNVIYVDSMIVDGSFFSTHFFWLLSLDMISMRRSRVQKQQ